MTPAVKICGLMRPKDIESSIVAGASYLGFIIEAASPRRLSVRTAARLARPVQDILPRVAVTVNASDDLLRRLTAEMAPDYIQCHGDETLERVAEIARVHKVKTIKAVAVSGDGDMKRAEQFSGVADLILYDAKPPKGSNVRGGHGLTIDWDVVRRNPTPRVFMLAGGLIPDNAAEAARRSGAPIVDVSSGVERAPGVKSAEKIKAFMEAVKHGQTR